MAHRLNPQTMTAHTLSLPKALPQAKSLMIRLIINLLVEPAE